MGMRMDIKVNVSDPGKVRSLKERFSLDLLSATILERRGVESAEDALYYLESDMIYQHSPLECDDVFTAIDRINAAIEDGEKILIFGDRDVDGITGSAILYRGLKKLGASELSVRLPEGDEPYGLTSDIVREILEKEYTLVITVDNGISAINEIKELEKSGVDVIVLDHHIPGDELPGAVALFDPKIPGCGYPFDSLAGCAVAAKMIWALNFSQTPLFGSECIILHAEPRNGSIRINAVRIENLIEIDRITEEVADGGGASQAKDRLMDFLAVNLPIIVLDADTEKKMLRRAFGNNVDINLEDMRSKLEALMPRAKGHSIFDLAMQSRAARYHDGDKEIETLVSLFRSISIYSYPSLSREYDELMEFAAIGTIADLMPMKNENRLIVRKGLKMLSEKPLSCFRSLLGRQNLAGKRLNSRDVSFYIAPVINAAGRMGHPSDALALLISDDPLEADGFTDNLLEMNKMRQMSEENALSLIKGKAAESFERLEGKAVIVSDEAVPRGLTGALASKLSKEYSVLSVVIAAMEDGRVSASVRCSDKYNAKTFLSAFSDLFDDYGGHRCAAGFSMRSENLDTLLQMMENYVAAMDEKGESDEPMTVDADIPPEYMTVGLWKLSELLEPFGQENEELRISIKDAVISDLIAPRSDQKFLRFSLRYGKYSWPAVWWNAGDDKEKFRKGMHVNAVFTPDINFWKGTEKEQLLIKDMEVVQ